MKVWASILQSVERSGSGALVTVVEAQGSTPREAGARMVVTPEGYSGTIGGGALEWRAIAEAQALFGGPPAVRQSEHVLGPDLGQCCGGRVRLRTEVFDRGMLPELQALARAEAAGRFTCVLDVRADRILRRQVSPDPLYAPGEERETFGEKKRRVLLFGAGHVGRALVLALAPLPFEVTWFDARPLAFPAAIPGNVTLSNEATADALLGSAEAGAFVLVMTHSHALDLAIVAAALRVDRFPYVGLIGSETKRARFVSRLSSAGLDPARLVCPIGVPGIRSKHPAAIAASTAAQLLERHEALSTGCTSETTENPERQRA
jgi:xanthine dehydrogenase accessory factor